MAPSSSIFRTSFTIIGDPVGKPRMTRQDRFKSRPETERYWTWASAARTAATGSPDKYVEKDILGIFIFAHLRMPPSWSQKKKETLAGSPHRQHPDSDNIAKGHMDALLGEDKAVAIVQCMKFWAYDDEEPRTDVFLLMNPISSPEAKESS